MSKILEYLLDNNAIEIKDSDPLFTWASGKQSPIYCDNRTLLSDPIARKNICLEFIKKIDRDKIDGIAAVATAGIAWGAIVAHEMDLPLIYVRSDNKKHGRKNLIEGNFTKLKKVILIEDLISTGMSSINAINALKAESIKVIKTLSLFNYNLEEGKQNFKDLECESLESINSLLASDFINIKQKRLLKDFLCS